VFGIFNATAYNVLSVLLLGPITPLVSSGPCADVSPCAPLLVESASFFSNAHKLTLSSWWLSHQGFIKSHYADWRALAHSAWTRPRIISAYCWRSTFYLLYIWLATWLSWLLRYAPAHVCYFFYWSWFLQHSATWYRYGWPSTHQAVASQATLGSSWRRGPDPWWDAGGRSYRALRLSMGVYGLSTKKRWYFPFLCRLPSLGEMPFPFQTSMTPWIIWEEQDILPPSIYYQGTGSSGWQIGQRSVLPFVQGVVCSPLHACPLGLQGLLRDKIVVLVLKYVSVIWMTLLSSQKYRKGSTWQATPSQH